MTRRSHLGITVSVSVSSYFPSCRSVQSVSTRYWCSGEAQPCHGNLCLIASGDEICLSLFVWLHKTWEMGSNCVLWQVSGLKQLYSSRSNKSSPSWLIYYHTGGVFTLTQLSHPASPLATAESSLASHQTGAFSLVQISPNTVLWLVDILLC